MSQTLEGDFLPANNYVLIVKSEAQEYSSGGVYIGKKPNKEFAGRVLAIGPGRLVPETGAVIPMTVKVGDLVLYDPPTEEPVLKYKNQECVLVPEEHIYARVETDGISPRPLSSADIRPISDRLLVRVIDSPKKTQSGLVLARSNETEGTIFRATVISIGPGEYTMDGKLLPVAEFKPGDTVLFSDAAADGGAFDLHRTQHAFVRRRAILAKV
ncbi:10 kDa family protein [Babesia ovata]|uniref:10 kDa family protein n=1 Tax=Babesia ovata TaxID=189622 RepID=A0A2H6K7K0_9APIC|nr:10 kDa family protein [Babesia ovata]GBE58929.1 10 kDa family protein [Babesia ovata]